MGDIRRSVTGADICECGDPPDSFDARRASAAQTPAPTSPSRSDRPGSSEPADLLRRAIDGYRRLDGAETDSATSYLATLPPVGACLDSRRRLGKLRTPLIPSTGGASRHRAPLPRGWRRNHHRKHSRAAKPKVVFTH
ncbi:hypothetical protein DMB37_31050 [Nocardia sp. CS682]|nr:hypothetical protein DMB37_31050 [Nocardia sp. CS682]